MVFQGMELGVGVSHHNSGLVNYRNAKACIVRCSFSNQLVYSLKKIYLIERLKQLVILNNLLNGVGKGPKIFFCLGDGRLLQGVEADDDKEHKATAEGESVDKKEIKRGG